MHWWILLVPMSAKMDIKDAANASAKDRRTHSDELAESNSDATGGGVTSEPTLACYCRGALI
jgi:hypothetical protein